MIQAWHSQPEAKYDFSIGADKIEVKTTASKADTEFFVTKNELEVSKEYKKSYFIYRVYDAKGLYPKFYRAAGCISDNFILDPVTYMARYKYS